MSREILKDIIQDFSPERFINFFRTKNRSFRPHNEYVSEYDDDDFKDASSIGQIPFHQTENLIIYSLTVTRNLSERSGKKAQYEKGKKILKDTQADAGIFIFYDTNNDFRFSLIYPEYAGTRRQWSSFKRFTYFISPEETNKTFIQRIGDSNFSSIVAIKEAFSVEKVTKEFYSEIANWYFWALKEARFPKDAEAEPKGRNIALIRLITRVIFIWFMRQKGIIKKELFDRESLKGILKDLSDKEDTYYKAVLQNLFFATLNTPIEQRKFRREERYKGYLNKDYMNHTYFRHHSLFKDPARMKELFNDIPFLNGGLFECLDKGRDDESNDTGREIRIDGFSDDPKKQSYVPNFLFISEEREIDLNEDYGTKNKRYNAKGLINILESYNFTIDENTPVDEEVALDPELLGRVFENLLASYNPETATTARKATGSYYTPREIVDYMVRESIKEYFKVKAPDIDEDSLNQLFLYDEDKNPFDDKTTEEIVNAIHNLKLIDPAVGSGAFPMGVLHTLVHILHKLDPHNEKWKQQQINAVQHILDPQLKQETLKRIEESFTLNELDYGRKLYLSQNCIYGVDIQPIAIQIAKLRFFISLLVDERVDKSKPNYGIEPLPNLETKFVVANTLIGLPRPNQLSLQTPDVVKLEDELKEIRNQYFIVSSTKEKEKLKKKDAELRKALAESLSESGWMNEATKKIARWNPYDTNKSADWFDLEWMFGIPSNPPLEKENQGGFDIVIANPPYVRVDDIAQNQKDILKVNYQSAVGKYDIYYLFFEKGLSLISHKGILTYISPNKFCAATSASTLRKLLCTKCSSIEIVSTSKLGVFEDAANYPVIAKLSNNCEGLMVREAASIETLNQSTQNIYGLGINYISFLPDFIIPINIHQSQINCILKIISRYGKLGAYFSISEGLRIPSDFEDNEINDYMIVKQYQFEKWTSIRDGSYISKKNLFKVVNQKSERFIKLSQPKILIAEDALSITATIDLNTCVPQGGVYFGISTYKNLNLKLLLGILNSKLLSFIYKILFAGMHMGGGYLRYRTNFLENMPIPEITSDERFHTSVIQLVDQILAGKKKDPSTDTSALERQIDKMVYAIYDLTPEEIKIIESHSKE